MAGINLHYKVKVRVNLGPFGHKDIGTIEDTRDVSALILGLVQKIVPGFAALASTALSALAQPHVLYDDRGVLIELQ